MVNIRLATIGKRPKLSFPRLSMGEEAKPSHCREVYLSRRQQAARLSGLSARGARRRNAASPDPALIQEHGTTTVLFESDNCVTVAPSGELIIT